MPRWSFTPPAVSGHYLYRPKNALQHERPCRAKVYATGELEVHDVESWDTVDNVSEYEFNGPVPTGRAEAMLHHQKPRASL